MTRAWPRGGRASAAGLERPSAPALAQAVVLAAGALLLASHAWRFVHGALQRHHVESAFFWYVGVAIALGLARPPQAASPAPAADRAAARAASWAFVAALGVALALYLPALAVGLLADDFVLLARAHEGRYFARQPLDRPLPLLILRGLGWAALDGPVLLHALNLALHGLNGWLVREVARRWGQGPWRATAAAALFLLFPGSVEPVAWIASLQDLLATTACLAFVVLVADGRQAWRDALALVLLLLGLLTKEIALVAPLLAVVVMARQGLADVGRRRVLWLGAGLSAAFAAWRLFGVGLDPEFQVGLSAYRLKELLSRPFAALAAPWADCLGRVPLRIGLSIATSAGLLAIFAAGFWRGAESFARALTAGLWICLSVAPLYAYFYVGPDLRNGRYLYLASVGWAVLLADMLAVVAGRATRLAAVALLSAVLGVYALTTRTYVGWWQDAALARDRALAEDAGRAPDGPPSFRCGVPIFVNGFDEARRAVHNRR